jgi:hypothetical protein
MFKAGDKVMVIIPIGHLQQNDIRTLRIHHYTKKLYIPHNEGTKEGWWVEGNEKCLKLLQKPAPKTEIEALDRFQQNFKY